MRVLSWNLKHGRAVPPARRELFAEFAAALAGWDWEVALLQEVPPWWPEQMRAGLGADAAAVLTSRNFGLPLRRAIALRWPEVIKSNGGGCNAILARGTAIEEHRVARLGWWPERRWVHAVRLGGVWVANVHLQSTVAQAHCAAATVSAWAAGAPSVLGGDFNVRALSLPGFDVAVEHGVDYVFVARLAVTEPGSVLERGALSDHAPVVVDVTANS